jgi:hypothetical protein
MRAASSPSNSGARVPAERPANCTDERKGKKKKEKKKKKKKKKKKGEQTAQPSTTCVAAWSMLAIYMSLATL